MRTGSALYLAFASLVGFAPTIVLAPFAGVLVDRWSRKVLIAAVDFLQALATVVLIFLFSLEIVTVWQVFILLGLRGIFQAFHSPAVSAIIPIMVPRDKLSRMNGVNFLFTGAVTLIGPVAAAILLEIWSIGEILWIDAGTFIVALIPLLIIGIPSVKDGTDKSEDDPSFRSQFGKGLSFIRNTKGLLPFAMLATALNFLLTPTSLFPFYVKFEHFGGAPDLAFVMAFFQGGVLAGGLLMSVIKGFQKKMVAITVSAYVIFFGYALVALTPTGLFWFMAAAGSFMAFCLPIANVTIQTITQTVVPLEMQGRVLSVLHALATAASPLGTVLAGVLVGFTGTGTLFLGCSVFGILTITLSWFFTDMKHIETAEMNKL